MAKADNIEPEKEVLEKALQKAQATEDLYSKVHKRVWSRRTAGFLAGATLLGTFGAVGGAIASFLPPVLGAMGVAGVTSTAMPGLVAIASNAALFGGAAAWLGMGIGADVGANSGAAVATIEVEHERMQQLTGKKAPEEPATPPALPVKLLNWKVAAVTTALFATFGALIALNPLTAVAVGLMGFKAGSTAAVIASATTLGMFGAAMGVNFPELSYRLTRGYSRLLKGKWFEKETAPAPVAEKEVAAPAPEQKSAPALNAEPEKETAPNFSTRAIRSKLSMIIEKTEDRNAEITYRS